MNRSQICNIWLTDTSVWIELNDGRKAEEKFSDYKRLAAATKEQRQNYRLSYFGIHWPEIDEDLSFEGFFTKRNNDMNSTTAC